MASESKPQAPVSVRVVGKDREALEELAQGGTTSGVLLQGLRLMHNLQGRNEMPLYPRCVEDEDVSEVIDRAAKAACEVLDELFPGEPPETRGISSNFIGGLREHIEAMLTGRQASRRTISLALKPLLGDYWSLGRIRGAEKNEGYCVVQPAMRLGREDLYFHSDRRGFVELKRITADTLYTSQEAAQKDVFEWMRKNDVNPRENPLRLCLLAWDPNTEGPLTVATVAT